MGFLCNKQKTVSRSSATKWAGGRKTKQLPERQEQCGQATAGTRKHSEHGCLPGHNTTQQYRGGREGCFPPTRWEDKQMHENCVINIFLKCFSFRCKDICVFEKKKISSVWRRKCFFSQFLNYAGNVFLLLLSQQKAEVGHI